MHAFNLGSQLIAADQCSNENVKIRFLKAFWIFEVRRQNRVKSSLMSCAPRNRKNIVFAALGHLSSLSNTI